MAVRRIAVMTRVVALTGAACRTTTTGTGTNRGGGSSSDAPVDLLHQRGTAAEAIATIERVVGASPARVAEVDIYPEYMFAEAQDPDIPDPVDQYQWHDDDGQVIIRIQISGPRRSGYVEMTATGNIRTVNVN